MKLATRIEPLLNPLGSRLRLPGRATWVALTIQTGWNVAIQSPVVAKHLSTVSEGSADSSPV